MSKKCDRINLSDVLYLIHNTTNNETFSFNDVSHLLNSGQISALSKCNYITKTNKRVHSKRLISISRMIPVWSITPEGLSYMKEHADHYHRPKPQPNRYNYTSIMEFVNEQ